MRSQTASQGFVNEGFQDASEDRNKGLHDVSEDKIQDVPVHKNTFIDVSVDKNKEFQDVCEDKGKGFQDLSLTKNIPVFLDVPVDKTLNFRLCL